MNMPTQNFTIWMQNLVIAYARLWRRHGIKWIIESNHKLAVQHIVSAIKPEYLRTRFEPDLSMVQYSWPRNCIGFMHHALKVSEALRLVEPSQIVNSPTNGALSGNRKKNRAVRNFNDIGSNSHSGSAGGSPKSAPSDKNKIQKQLKVPICLYGLHRKTFGIT